MIGGDEERHGEEGRGEEGRGEEGRGEEGRGEEGRGEEGRGEEGRGEEGSTFSLSVTVHCVSSSPLPRVPVSPRLLPRHQQNQAEADHLSGWKAGSSSASVR